MGMTQFVVGRNEGSNSHLWNPLKRAIAELSPDYEKRLLDEYGCRIVQRTRKTEGLYKVTFSVIIEFENDEDLTMFLLRWA
jgi:hypothetical protein